ncbi:hypothetical protein BY458DRAFT_517649 [Sporodiniella umbellata]|nr:hypothetical protein BY458DRAFT_517649 [Sporodiniella umbellata]
MQTLLNNEWPDRDIKPNVFGSFVNHLGTSASDIDLCITTPWNGLKNVRVLAKLFRKCGMQHVVCVPRAKVPIVRLFDPEMQLSCDINVNNTIALQNTEMIKVYVALDPRVRPLIMILKHWTKQRLMNDAANGGTLSSYTWTCMIINFLQQRKPPILPVLCAQKESAEGYPCFDYDITRWQGFGRANRESLGGLFYAFFRRFALEFDYETQVISVRQGRYLDKKDKGWDTGRDKASLCVEEPFNTSRNLGNSADLSSVLGLRTEFQRCVDLILDQADLDSVLACHKPWSDPVEMPSQACAVSLTLPTPMPLEAEARHPYDRRKSMVDGIYQEIGPSTFHPRFSSSQALDSVIQSRNARHGSHPSSPGALLQLFHSRHPPSIDSLFTRGQKKKAEPQTKAKSKPRRAQHKEPKRRFSLGPAEWPSISKVTPQEPVRKEVKTLAEIIKVSTSATTTAKPKKTTKTTHKANTHHHRPQKNKSNNKLRA